MIIVFALNLDQFKFMHVGLISVSALELQLRLDFNVVMFMNDIYPASLKCTVKIISRDIYQTGSALDWLLSLVWLIVEYHKYHTIKLKQRHTVVLILTH